MKVIITGGSGFIGTEVITQCLSNPAFSEVIALSRKPLPSSLSKNDKLRTILMGEEDWTDLGEVVKQCEGVGACIWCLGTKDLKMDPFAIRRISVDYTITAARAFSSQLTTRSTTPFRFAYLSGAMVERDHNKKTWFANEALHIRGDAETELLQLADTGKVESSGGGAKGKGALDVMVARPALVTGPTLGWGIKAMAAVGVPSIRVETLARTLIDFAVEGDRGRKQVWENADLNGRG